MKYFVYILHTETFDKYYKGFSIDPFKRLKQHNNKESRYTSNFTPWKLIYIEELPSKREALIREKVLKKYSKKQIVQLLNSPKNHIS